jgi:hypothetical protein
VGLLGLCLFLWRLRALPSQKRALAGGQVITAMVTPPPAGTAPARRTYLDWRAADGIEGRSKRITRRWRWLPHTGQTIRLLIDPASGRRWWEGDLRAAPLSPAPFPQAPQMPLSRALNTGWALLALAGIVLPLALAPLAPVGWLLAGG